TAEALVESFYRQLVEHGEVDLALDSATAAVSSRDDVLVPALYSRLGGRPLFSDSLDRPLTPEELDNGLQRLQTLLSKRAPVLNETFNQQKEIIGRTRGIEGAALSEAARLEKQSALEEINEISGEVLDLSFNAVAIGNKVPEYDKRCPFRGLYPFRLEDQAFFYGREKLVESLKSELTNYPLLPVLGDSGSGKSSLVLAGLVPALQKDKPNLKLAYMTPSYHPLEELETSLSTVQNQPFILVVDQFEELFTLCADKKEQKAFVQRLLSLVDSGRNVVFTIRTDFWGKCIRYKELTQRPQVVEPMNTAELRTAMEQQAHKVGLRFEAGLSNTILDAVQEEPGAMPLLQHALRELWIRRHGQWLVDREYRNFGGIKEAIAQTADSFYADLPSDEQTLMQNIFVRLTRLDTEAEQGAPNQDTRRRVNLEELVPAKGSLDKTKSLVNRLAGEGARLVITSENANSQQTEVEVAHEALIRSWPRLKDWLEKNRSNYETREDIRQDIQQWKKGGYEDEDLISSKRLEQAKNLLRLGLLNESEQTYIEKSLEFQERKRQKELRRAKRNSRVALVFSTILVALSAFSWKQRREAVNSKKTADKGKQEANLKEQSAKASSWISTGKSAEGLMLSLMTLNQSTENSNYSAGVAFDAKKSIGNAVQHAREKNFLLGHEKDVRAVAYDPNNYYIVSGGLDQTLRLWDAVTGEELTAKENAHFSSIYAVAFSPDGKYIASGGNDNALRVWTVGREKSGDLSISPKTSREAHGGGSVLAVAFSPEGDRIVSAGDDQTLRLWSINTGSPIGPPMTGHTSSVWSVAFSPDGKYIASGSVDRSIKIWDARTGELNKTISNAHRDSVFSVAFSSDSQRIVSGSADRHIRMWDVNTGNSIGFPLIGHDGTIYSAMFGPEDQTIISAGSDRAIRFWHADTSTPIGQITEAHSNLIWDLALGDEGEQIISASSDHSVRLWDIDNDLPGQPQRTPHTKSILSIAVSPSGNYVLSGGEDRMLSLWDANAKKLIWKLSTNSHTAPIQSVAFRPRKEQFVSGS
ncbi:MAG: WD40 repeat domain-containing protein, partial [Phormidesmis sp.]